MYLLTVDQPDRTKLVIQEYHDVFHSAPLNFLHIAQTVGTIFLFLPNSDKNVHNYYAEEELDVFALLLTLMFDPLHHDIPLLLFLPIDIQGTLLIFQTFSDNLQQCYP